MWKPRFASVDKNAREKSNRLAFLSLLFRSKIIFPYDTMTMARRLEKLSFILASKWSKGVEENKVVEDWRSELKNIGRKIELEKL